jgi:hypothetical protein
MKHFYSIVVLIMLFTSGFSVKANQGGSLEFIPNLGQWEGDFTHKVNLLDGGTLYLEPTTFTFHYYEEAKRSWLHHNNCANVGNAEQSVATPNNYCDNDKIKNHVYKMHFFGRQ